MPEATSTRPMTMITPPSLVLVTGANGFIASHTVSLLLQRGFRVLGTVRTPIKAKLVKQTHAQISPKTVHLLETAVVEDITSTQAYRSLIQEHKPAAILHMASPFTYSTTDFERELLQPAVRGTEAILEAAATVSSVRRVVQTNSFACVYDAAMGPRRGYTYTARDFSPLAYADGVGAANAAMAYRASKAVAEQTAYHFLETAQPAFDFVSLCPAMVFGPFLETQHSFPKGLEELNTSNQLVWDVVGESDQGPVPPTKGPVWIDVRDVAEAHVKALLNPKTGGRRMLLAKGVYCSQEIADVARQMSCRREGRIPIGVPGKREAEGHFGVDASMEEKELGSGGKWRELSETLRDLVPQLWAIEAGSRRS